MGINTGLFFFLRFTRQSGIKPVDLFEALRGMSFSGASGTHTKRQPVAIRLTKGFGRESIDAANRPSSSLSAKDFDAIGTMLPQSLMSFPKIKALNAAGGVQGRKKNP